MVSAVLAEACLLLPLLFFPQKESLVADCRGSDEPVPPSAEAEGSYSLSMADPWPDGQDGAGQAAGQAGGFPRPAPPSGRPRADMAAPAYPAWVTRWVSGQWRNKKRPPTLRPPRTLALADKVANRREQSTEATCITEMSVMMACWKQNDFNDTPCAEEIRMFYDCVAKAEKERKNQNEDMLSSRGNLPSSKVNKLLKRFPQITRYV
ncbi:small ribosomal subunit protein mS37 [Haemorhous mexicanus]|uniref:small ribosomal subunit protein mS37 n=1 Tax=Haemorhous mexicanus TaxID=30427 RepID=UPI0028BED0B1|nr:small ribosomal subunit protein mS37 [Haemorhous mexicanus]